MPRLPLSRHVVLALLLVSALGAALPLRAAPASPRQEARRPRIALALGGGSARGLAHVGVLQWLHEHRVPVDDVAGTSMGALIGAAYAVGMTAPEIEATVRSIDWDAVLAAQAPFADATFRRKEDRRAFPAGLQLGLRHGLWLPRSLNSGQRVALLIDRLTAPYSDVPNFDDLPTPFRCVAFDVDRAERVVLGSGILPEALRATMALPGIFPPVEIDGRLLIDGGLADNVPADVARDMGADVVIAVNVNIDPKAEGDVTALSMVNRTIDAVMVEQARAALARADIVIRPDMARLSSTDWNRADEWRLRGYRAAEAQAPKLLKYALSPEAYAAHEAARLARRRTAPIVPAGVEVEGVGPGEQAAIARQLDIVPGRPLDVDRLTHSLLLLSGTDRFDLLTYHLARAGGAERLVVRARPRANGPAFLTLGLEVNNTDSATFAANILARTTIFDAVGRGSEVRLDAVIGTRQYAAAELYRPLGVSWLFAAPRAFADRATRNRFFGGRLVGEYALTRAGGGLDVGVTARRILEVRAGLSAAHVSEALRVGDPSLPGADGVEREASVHAILDTEDSPSVPSRGVYARASARRLWAAPVPTGDPSRTAGIPAPQRFWQAQADVSGVHSLSERNRLFARVAGGTSFGAQPYVEDFSLGGPFRMSAFRNDELRGSNFALAVAGYLRQLPRLPAWVGGRAYLAAWLEGGSAFLAHTDPSWHGDVSTGLIVDSLVGPLFVGGSWGPDGHHRVYVSLGPLFR